SGQLDTIQSLIGRGLGVSFVPRMAMLNTVERVCYCPLTNPQPRRTIAIIWHERNPLKKPAQAFFNHLREAGKTFKPPTINHRSLNSKSKA
ncbi:MAG: LysR family transcriptional regulator substrate-binding protein, partial [Limisphaerales bacterium]